MAILSEARDHAQAHHSAHAKRRRKRTQHTQADAELHGTPTLPGIRLRWSHSLPYEGAPEFPYADIGEQPMELKMHLETAVEEFIKRTGMRPTDLTVAVIASCELPGE